MAKEMQMTADGDLLMLSGGDLMGECCCEEEEAVPESCEDFASLSDNDYRIKDYTDGYLTACDECDDEAVDPAWDGTFPTYLLSLCGWKNVTEDIHIDGKDGTGLFLTLQPIISKWRVQVSCLSGGSPVIIWRGQKATGATPAGVYTRTLGCSIRETLEIEQYT